MGSTTVLHPSIQAARQQDSLSSRSLFRRWPSQCRRRIQVFVAAKDRELRQVCLSVPLLLHACTGVIRLYQPCLAIQEEFEGLTNEEDWTVKPSGLCK